jgi:hypothetical protein
VLDLTFWHVLPDRITWLGAAVIVASGLYLVRRDRIHPGAGIPEGGVS